MRAGPFAVLPHGYGKSKKAPNRGLSNFWLGYQDSNLD